MNQITAKLESMTAGAVWEVITGLADKLDDASDMVMTAALEVLELKVSEDKYIELMDKLYSDMG